MKSKQKLREGFDFATCTQSHYDLVVNTINQGWDQVTWATYRVHRIQLVQQVATGICRMSRNFRLIIGIDEQPTPVDEIVIGALPKSMPKNASIKLLACSHAKFILCERKNNLCGILTTKNLGAGDWHEYSCLLTQEQSAPLKQMADKLWRLAKPVSKVMTVTNHTAEIDQLFKGIK